MPPSVRTVTVPEASTTSTESTTMSPRLTSLSHAAAVAPLARGPGAAGVTIFDGERHRLRTADDRRSVGRAER